jgi:septum formation protein
MAKRGDSILPCQGCYTGQVRELILASESPRRKELLAVAGLPFTVRARPVEEVRRAGEAPVEYVRRLAQDKAEAAWMGSAGEIVLGADTVVVVDEAVLEKPLDEDDAASMIGQLAGREHNVITGICLRHLEGAVVDHAITRVTFTPMSGQEIRDYVASGEPIGKAGAYAIQGLASRFVERIDGCYFNVMGLPLSLVYRHWKGLA